VLLVAAVVLAPIAAAQTERNVTGRPDLRAFLPEDRVTPGTEATLSVYLDNRGELFSRGPDEFETLVQTARSTTVAVRADGEGRAGRPGVESGSPPPIEVLTAEQPVGDVPPGVVGPIPVRVRVAETAPPGQYRLPLVVRYQHTDRVRLGSDGTDRFEESVTDRLPLVVRVVDGARFEVVGASGAGSGSGSGSGSEVGPDASTPLESGVPPGETGPVTVRLTNVGGEPARDATVRLRSGDPEVTFGDGAALAESYVGDWPAGATRAATVRLRVAPDALVREYGLVATVAYRTVEGERVESSPVAVGLRPATGPRLQASGVVGDLRAGASGSIRGVVTNDGDATAREVLVRVRADSPAVTPTEPAAPVGDLAPGASAAFVVPVEVVRGAEPGPRRVTVSLERRVDGGGGGGSAGGGETGPEGGERAVSAGIRTTTVGATVTVAAGRDPFSVEPVAASVPVDGTTTLVVRVRNDGPDRVRDVRVAVTAAPPFESAAPAAFVPALAPGETAAVSFPIETVAEAVPGTNAVELAFTYEDAAGDVRTSDPVPVAVSVTPEPTGDVLLPAALAMVALLAVGVWYWRRR
jgi:hypothetical protein